jgi:hypothetical protein
VNPYIANIEAVRASEQTLRQLVQEAASVNEVMASRIPYHGGMPPAVSAWQVARHAWRRRTSVLYYSLKEETLSSMDNWHSFCHSQVSVFHVVFFSAGLLY